MQPEAMMPYGLCLRDYHEGNRSAVLTMIRDDGLTVPLPAGIFFRNAQEFEIENLALEMAHGHVLDVGAGTGLHSLFLQKKGLPVCAIDLSPQAIQIMQERGVLDARQEDIMTFEGGRFDTILMMGHGIGIVENISGLDRFLCHAGDLLHPQGRILLTSLDVRVTGDPKNLAYHKQNLDSGRYFGEIRMQMEYKNTTGPLFGWLHVDAETLGIHADALGWRCTVVHQQEDGNYLAQLGRVNE